MATINYELGKPNKKNERSIFFLVCQGNVKKRIPTPLVVKNSDLTDKGKISPRKTPKLYQSVTSKLSELEERLIDVEMENLGKVYDVETLTRMILARNSSLDFFAFADEWLKQSDMKGKKNYATFLNSLERYRGVRSLPVEVIDYSFLDGYCNYLKDKPRAQSLYMGNFRHIFRQIRLRYDNVPNPFEKFKVPKQVLKGQRSLSLDILRRVFAYQGTGRAQLARDCAVLSFCLMGMNAVDLYNAKEIKDGKVCYNRTKTMNRRQDNAYIEVAVPPVCKPLMKKYKGDRSVFDFRKRYSSADDFGRALNIGLKTITEHIVKEERERGNKNFALDKLQFYQFRHTWATIARNDLGIDYYTVGSALNHIHRDDIVTDIYIKKDFTQINIANKKVVDFVFR